MKLYWASVSFVYPTDEGPRETTLHIEYESEGLFNAVEDAKRFGGNRCRAFDDWTLACIKVGELQIREVDTSGYLPHGKWGFFFEWKYDWPGEFQDYVKKLLREIRHGG